MGVSSRYRFRSSGRLFAVMCCCLIRRGRALAIQWRHMGGTATTVSHGEVIDPIRIMEPHAACPNGKQERAFTMSDDKDHDQIAKDASEQLEEGREDWDPMTPETTVPESSSDEAAHEEERQRETGEENPAQTKRVPSGTISV